MKNTIGESFAVTLFGESHGPAVGAVLDGVAPGIPLDLDAMRRQLALRRPAGALSTARQEADEFSIVSGLANGFTTGTPLTILIPNQSQHSGDYAALANTPRPSHADYTAQCKYHGFQDAAGGGHFSGRITAPLVAAGALALQILSAHGIMVGTHIARCAGVQDAPLPTAQPELNLALQALNQTYFATVSNDAAERMQQAAAEAKDALDSVGGVLETVVTGLPVGVGEPWFDTVEGVLAKLLFSVPAVKGVEFGTGFALADLRGSSANDAFVYDAAGRVTTATNHSGGVNGGITNGMPLVVRCVVKPTPSIYKPQHTVDLGAGQNTTIAIQGRHDPAIVHRARVVADSVIALGLVDLCSLRYGTDWQRIRP